VTVGFGELLTGAAMDYADEVRFRLTNLRVRRAHPRPVLSVETIDSAIQRGASFLVRHQSTDGSLRGFLLLPGTSTAWITAHAAFVLEQVQSLEPLCRKAAHYLAETGARDGGWAWNEKSRIDLDSTALALMVLDRFNLPVDEPLVEAIEACQSESGGFPTFGPNRSGVRGLGWQAPHPEVTAVVIEMLRRLNRSRERIDRAMAWLLTQVRDGAMPSYWWEGWAYGLWILSRAQFMSEEAATRARRILCCVRTAPDLPMVLVSAMTIRSLVHPDMASGISRLLRAQLEDGSWRCGRTLRVTKMFEYEAATIAPGRTYPDRRRTFSTAHSVAALQLVRSILVAQSLDPASVHPWQRRGRDGASRHH